MSNQNSGDIPLGLGMALAQNQDAMTHFASLSAMQRQAIIEAAHHISSKQQMQSLVSELAAGGTIG